MIYILLSFLYKYQSNVEVIIFLYFKLSYHIYLICTKVDIDVYACLRN